jgi:hypothetical protein
MLVVEVEAAVLVLLVSSSVANRSATAQKHGVLVNLPELEVVARLLEVV